MLHRNTGYRYIGIQAIQASSQGICKTIYEVNVAFSIRNYLKSLTFIYIINSIALNIYRVFHRAIVDMLLRNIK